MSKILGQALSQGAWSVSAVMSDLNAMLDDEGRPISERRADAMTRVGVEMEMKLCPFHDIRKDKWMNVSALEQITRYMNPVLEEMEAFRRYSGNDLSWDEVLACVIDQLFGPAIYLLQQRSLQGPIPARIAVGHKLAAGMYGVMLGLSERRALGSEFPVSVDTFLNLIVETEALVGATYEACAGSMAMIRKASTSLIEGNPDNRFEVDPLRLDLAHCLALQVQLGIFWKLFDRVHLWSLLRGEYRDNLNPANRFLQNKLEHEANNLDPTIPPSPDRNRLPDALDATVRLQLAEALDNACNQQTFQEEIRTITALLNQTNNPVQFNGDVKDMAQHIACYLHTYRLFKAELSKIELELREHLGFPQDTPIRLGDAALPTPQALSWYELILGSRLGKDDRFIARNPAQG
jgi:hypothetical protein